MKTQAKERTLTEHVVFGKCIDDKFGGTLKYTTDDSKNLTSDDLVKVKIEGVKGFHKIRLGDIKTALGNL